jgi:hypothetical protein
MGRFIRISISFAITLLLGGVVFAGIAWVVGLFFPAAAKYVFIILASWWAWIGWVYASRRDRARSLGLID